MKKRLIINADDFGMSKEVNEGTKKGIEAGVITSVSVMVNMPYFSDAIAFLKKHKEVSVGLHFNITEGQSIQQPSDVSSFIREDNSFFYYPQLIAKFATKTINKSEVANELKAQYQRLKDTGLTVTHIDSHHHVHLYPSLFRIVSDFADKEKVHSLRGNEFDLWNLTLGIWKKPIPTQLIVNFFLLLVNLRVRNGHHLYEIDRFYDINWAKDISPKDFVTILENLPEGTTEFICHLATVSKTGNAKFLVPRFKALQLLIKPEIKKQLTKNGITLTPH